jgi:iron(III) transport system ATP-binding protein
MRKVIQVENLSKSFDNAKLGALNNVSFSLLEGDILAVVGESGSGKTTLTRLIAGLETVDNGEISINDKLVSSIAIHKPVEKRKIGMVFQDYALFPHLTVYKNVCYGISNDSNQKERVNEVLKLVGLEGYEKRYPHELSGGQQQRVALARSLAPKPKLLILDEPFSNLDVILRKQLRNEIAVILKKTNTTAIFVTHDINDALAISNEIIVLQNGNLLQKGKTKEVFENANNEYVKSLFNMVKF